MFQVIFQKRVRVFHRGFKHEKTADESTRPQAECFYCFRVFEPRWNTKHKFLKLLLQQKKITLNYHLKKVSQFNYYIWDVKCAWCAWSYHLTAALWQIFEYSSTDVTLLPSCLSSVLSEHVASQSKWQSADLDLLKLAKKRKSVCSALFRGNVCIWSDKISNVSAILGRKSTTRLKVNHHWARI